MQETNTAKKMTKYIITGLLVFLLILAFESWIKTRKINELRSDNSRLTRNQTQLIADTAKKRVLIFKEKELSGRYLKERDSLAKALKIRPKTIEKIVTEVITQRDTEFVEVPVFPFEEFAWNLYDGGECWKWEGEARLEQFDLMVNRKLFDYKNEVKNTYWWERSKKILFIHFGKKVYYHEATPQCGDIKTEEINIIKK